MELGHGIIRVVPTGESLSKGLRVSIRNLHFSGQGWKLEPARELSGGGSPGGTLGSKVGNLWVTIQRDLGPPKSCEHQSSSYEIGLTTSDCSLVLRLPSTEILGKAVNSPAPPPPGRGAVLFTKQHSSYHLQCPHASFL